VEILNPAHLQSQYSPKTLEKLSKTGQDAAQLFFGVPKERSNDEKRVCLTPAGVSVLVANGHRVLIEKSAGLDAHFTDQEYSEAGADICFSTEELFRKSDFIVKVAPPTEAELQFMQTGQVLMSAVHLGGANEAFFKTMIEKNITGIGFEFLKSVDGSYPIVRMMHEITGIMSVQIASHYMETNVSGPGLVIGGVSGVPPATVVILGAGIIGEYAARTALGYGAQVFVMDNDLTALRRLENALDRRIITAMANHQYLSAAVKSADILIGAALEEGHKAPCLVTEQMVATMKAGSVIVDTVIDQGGCIETSRATSHSNPVFRKHDIIHYCVPNVPSNVARSATYALNNVVVPFLVSIGDAGGVEKALWTLHALRSGIYVYHRHMTQSILSKQFELPYREIDMLMASRM
jgi:alanine dehydrogenase